MRAELASLEAKINHRFSDPEILLRALTHSSHANEARIGTSPSHDNEELEFLGDSILGFLIAEALVARFPEYREGQLSRLKAHLVSAVHLYGVARRLDLGSYLELGRSALFVILFVIHEVEFLGPGSQKSRGRICTLPPPG